MCIDCHFLPRRGSRFNAEQIRRLLEGDRIVDKSGDQAEERMPPAYGRVADYDPVLRAHSRLDREG
jgi:hypothetical protein